MSRAPSGPRGRGSAGGRPSRRTTTSTRRTTRAAEPVTDGVPGQVTPPPPPSRARLTGRAAVLLLVVAVLGVSYAASIRAWLNQRGEVGSLSAQIAATKADNVRLLQEKQRWRDPAFVESQARLRFGWIMPGERGYRVIGKDGKVLTQGSDSLRTPTGPPKAQSPWWESLWGTVQRAGDPAPTVSGHGADHHSPAVRDHAPTTGR